MTDRAQSESLGFAAIFGVVMLMILIVTVAAYPGLQNIENNQRVENVEKGFDALASNINDLISSDANSRETRIRLAGGQLALGDSVNITISNEVNSFSESYNIHPLVYRSNAGATIVYLNGAVIRGDNEGSIMLREPEMVMTNDVIVFAIVDLETDEGGVGGSSTVGLETTTTANHLDIVNTSDSQNVTFTISSPRAEAWRDGLTDAYEDVECSGTESTTTCWIDPSQRLYVTRVQIDVTFT